VLSSTVKFLKDSLGKLSRKYFKFACVKLSTLWNGPRECKISEICSPFNFVHFEDMNCVKIAKQ